MSYKILLVLNAIVVLALGLVLLFAPDLVLAQFKMNARVAEVFMSRVIGAALASLGLLLWFAKDVEVALQNKMSLAALVGAVLAMIVTVIGLIGKLFPVNGWMPLVVEVVFGLGYAFLLFLKPRMKE